MNSLEKEKNPPSVRGHRNFSPGGGIGRHARLRIWCRKVCGFESHPGHHFGFEDLSSFIQNRLRLEILKPKVEPLAYDFLLEAFA